jgi:hypothetical protein
MGGGSYSLQQLIDADVDLVGDWLVFLDQLHAQPHQVCHLHDLVDAGFVGDRLALLGIHLHEALGDHEHLALHVDGIVDREPSAATGHRQIVVLVLQLDVIYAGCRPQTRQVAGDLREPADLGEA